MVLRSCFLLTRDWLDGGEQENADASTDGWFTAEFSAWTMAALAPLFTSTNGRAVSRDQAAVRAIAFGLPLTAGIAIRVAKIVRRRRKNSG